MNLFNVEIASDGDVFNVDFINSQNKRVNKLYSLKNFNSLNEVNHYLKNIKLDNNQKIASMVLYSQKNDWIPTIYSEWSK